MDSNNNIVPFTYTREIKKKSVSTAVDSEEERKIKTGECSIYYSDFS
jgi:hypothetical protein